MNTIQNIIFPEQGICTEADLYFHLHGDSGYNGSDQSVHLGTGAAVQFDSYFNLFSVGKWFDNCSLKNLNLMITGSGEVEIRVYHAIPERSWELLACEMMKLGDKEQLIDLSHYRANATRGLIFFEAKGMSKAVISGARFTTKDRPSNGWPKLAISITTFKREEEVEATAVRLEKFVKEFEQSKNLHIQIVDNGKSAKIKKSSKISYYPNANLGGAGGFARGLQIARDSGFSHCLFMDDDATFHMENIRRTYMMLALADDTKTAVAGAMINNSHKWAMWENGAIFNGSCHPQFIGTDLRKRNNVFKLEFKSARQHSKNFYGGWWYFAFPIEHVKRNPFPFFVRGDDISFSLANDFNIATLNGVVSFQDDFTEKESPQTLYLDLRSHLLHHLLFDSLERGPIGCAKVALRFILRSLVRFHYETAEAQLLAWRDVMEGPDFFHRHMDMSERRQSIKNLTKNETWHPIEGLNLDERRKYTYRGKRWHWVLTRSLNGHFLPFFKRWGDKVNMPIGERGNLHSCWGAAEITYLNSQRDKGYTVGHSKLRFLAFSLRLIPTMLRFVIGYKGLQKEYRTRYPEMTSEKYWQQVLASEKATEKSVAATMAS